MAPRVVATLAIAGLIGLGACNEERIPFYNGPTTVSSTPAGVTSALFAVLEQPRVDASNWAIWTGGMAREATYFTNSESRFVTELTGKQAIQPDDFIGATVWDNQFGLVKTADTAVAAIAKAGFTGQDATQLWALFETGKALNFMVVLFSRDTLGIPMNAVGQSAPPFAPFLCASDAWAQIIAMLDSSADSLAASAGDPNPVSLPLGYAAVTGTSETFASFNFALRAKARLEYAYALARASGVVAPGATLSGAALAQLDSAQLDVDSASLLHAVPSAASTTPGTDGGVFYTFSTQAGDAINPVFNFIKGYYALTPYVKSINTADARFAAKFVNTGARPAAASAVLVDAAGDTIASTWNYSLITASSPEPIVRSLELNFIDARIQLGMGNFAAAVDTINMIRSLVGGVGPATAATAADAAALIVSEAQITFIGEGTGQDIMAIRDYGLQNTFFTTWSTDTKASLLPVPVEESDPRGGNVAPTCSGSPAHAVSSPTGKTAPKSGAASRSIIRLH
jgi:hypothetical protein